MADAATYAPSPSIAPALSGRATIAARAISDLCSPAALALPCLLLAVWASRTSGTIWYALLYFGIAIPLPMVYVVWLVKTGRVRDFHLPDRGDRVGPFTISLASALAAVALLVYYRAPADFLAPIVAVFVQTLLLFLITLAWQISVHTATTAGLAMFAALALGGQAVALVTLVPLVAWARIHLGRHTVLQTIAGAALGGATFVLLFALRGAAW